MDSSQVESFAFQLGQIFGIFISIILFIGIPVFFLVSIIKFSNTKTNEWKILSMISGILLIVPLGLIVYGIVVWTSNIQTHVVGDRNIPKNRVIFDSDSLCQITIPDHWTILTNLHEDATIQVGNLRKEEYLILLTDLRLDFQGSLDEHVEITIGNMINNIEDATTSGPQQLFINGNRAIRHQLEGTVDRIKIIYYQTTIAGRFAYYQILAWTLPSKAAKASAVFEEVVSTFRERTTLPPPTKFEEEFSQVTHPNFSY